MPSTPASERLPTVQPPCKAQIRREGLHKTEFEQRLVVIVCACERVKEKREDAIQVQTRVMTRPWGLRLDRGSWPDDEPIVHDALVEIHVEHNVEYSTHCTRVHILQERFTREQPECTDCDGRRRGVGWHASEGVADRMRHRATHKER